MKNLNSYKKIAKEFIKESAWDRKFGEPLPTLEDVMNEVDVMDKTIKDKDGNDIKVKTAYDNPDHELHDKAKDMVKQDKGDDDSGEKDSGGKLGGSDFSRDGGDKGDVPVGQLPDPSTRQGDPEANKAYQAKKAAKAKAAEKPKAEPKDITGSIAGDEDAKEFAQALAQDLETNRSFQGLKDAGHEDLAKAIYNADSEEEKFDLVRKALEEPDEPKGKSSASKEKLEKEIEQVSDKIQDEVDSMDPDVDYIQKLISKRDELEDMLDNMDESIKVINGKKYRAIKESKEPTKQKIHSFKKMYKRIGGK